MPKQKDIKFKNQHSEKKNVIPFANKFCDISPRDLEEIMEWLDDNNYLSEKGIIFRNRFWYLFIKEK